MSVVIDFDLWAGVGHIPTLSNNYGWATYSEITAVKVLSDGVAEAS